jgi:hypothetical protein
MPFANGVAQNRKTGYTFSNKYDKNSSRLELKITYPKDVNPSPLVIFLDKLFDSSGTLYSK